MRQGRRKVEERLREHLVGKTSPYRELVGTGGTVRTLVEVVGKDAFDGADLQEILQREVHGPLWENLPPHRRRVLLPGILVLEGLFNTLRLERIVYRTASVKRGILSFLSLLPPTGL
jgi:exopolyphosphatase/pppGpp-phosphohydrolase